MQKPDKIPEAVHAALRAWAKAHPSRVQHSLTGEERTVPWVPFVSWDSMNGCYFFEANGMYHGVELDGHIHT